MVFVLGSTGALAAAAILLCVLFFIGVLLDAALSWMVLEVVQGKDTSLASGLKRALGKTGSLVIYTVLSVIVMLLAGKIREGDGGFALRLIKGFFAGLLEEAWDIASHLLLPAMMLKNHDFGSAIKELPGMVKHLPQVLVGGFAFDIVVRWLYLIEFVISLMFLLIFVGLWPLFAIIFSFSLFLFLVASTYIVYSFAKSVYFTLLYIDLHPEVKKSK
jgi:hypothetical protein